MKRLRYSENQIMAILKQPESGIPIPRLCREHGMSSACFYQWRFYVGNTPAIQIYFMLDKAVD
jgi:putative transposase